MPFKKNTCIKLNSALFITKTLQIFKQRIKNKKPIFFLGNTYKFCYEKKIVENCWQFFCKIFCVKYFFRNKFVKIFANFIISQEIITHEEIACQLKFLKKIAEKNLFLQIFLTNLQKKFSSNMKFFKSGNKRFIIDTTIIMKKKTFLISLSYCFLLVLEYIFKEFE